MYSIQFLIVLLSPHFYIYIFHIYYIIIIFYNKVINIKFITDISILFIHSCIY